MQANREQRWGGSIVLAAIALGLALLANGCAPASSTQYTRHLRMSHEPNHVDADAYAAAQRIYGEPQAGTVLAGAFADETNDYR